MLVPLSAVRKHGNSFFSPLDFIFYWRVCDCVVAVIQIYPGDSRTPGNYAVALLKKTPAQKRRPSRMVFISPPAAYRQFFEPTEGMNGVGVGRLAYMFAVQKVTLSAADF